MMPASVASWSSSCGTAITAGTRRGREHRGGGPGRGWDDRGGRGQGDRVGGLLVAHTHRRVGGGAGQQRGEHQPAQRAPDPSQHPHAAQRDGGRGSRAARKKPRTCARRASSAVAPMGSRSMRPSRNGTSLK